MRIAMVVHNSIISDSRVRKEAKTLKDNGYDITLFGYGDSKNAPVKIDEIPITIIEKVSYQPIILKLIRLNQTKRLLRLKIYIDFFYKLGKKIIRRLYLLCFKKTRPFQLFLIRLVKSFYKKTLPFQLFLIHLVKSFYKKTRPFQLFLIRLVKSFYKKTRPFQLFLIRRRNGLYRMNSLLSKMLKAMVVLKFAKIYALDILIFPLLIKLLVPNYLLIILILFIRILISNIDNFTGYLINLINNNRGYVYKHIASLQYKFILKGNYDVIHAHDIIGLIVGARLKKKKPKTILIWDAHELYTELNYKFPKEKIFIEKTINSCQSQIDFFITINQSISDFYYKNYPMLPPATILMNATKYSTSIVERSNKLREHLKINSSQKILIFQGGMSPGRGINLLIEAATLFSEEWTLVFMGNGNLVDEIKAKAEIYNSGRDKNRPNIISIPPAPYEELAEWTSGADLGIIPYELTSLNHLYCTPNKLWEFPNAGVPFIASGFDEMKKMINKYGTGILLPKNFKSEDISNIINSINVDQINRMKKNCYEFNKVENWGKYEPKLLSIYNNIKLKNF